MKTPKEFTEAQWRLTKNQMASRMLSVMCESFGGQFFILYIMQNLDVQMKSLQTVSVSMTAVVGSVLLLVSFIKSHAVQLAYPLILVNMLFCILCDLLIIQYPVMVLFVMSIAGGLGSTLMGGSWSVILNRCFQGDAKSGNGFWVGAGATIGVSFGSLLVYLFADLPLTTVVWIDIALSVVNAGLTMGRIWELKRYLKKHPYKETNNED